MKLRPKRTKYARYQKGRIRTGYDIRSSTLSMGFFAIQALEKGNLKEQHLEAVRRTLTSKTNRKIKIWLRAFPDYPITKKPSEVRMGRGKGNVDHWVCKINEGKILFEVSGSNPALLKNALHASLSKLPIKTRIIEKYEDLR